MRDGIRKDLLVPGEIAESSDLWATPFEFESESLSYHNAGSWKSKGAARRIAHGRAAARWTFIIPLRCAICILIV